MGIKSGTDPGCVARSFDETIMTTKHIFEDSHGLVDKAVLGAAATNPALRVYVKMEGNG